MKGMKKGILGALLTGMLVFLLAACGGNAESKSKDAENENNTDGNTKADSNDSSDDALQVVASFTIIADVANEIGGEDVAIHNSVSTGTDPHEYELLPEDIKNATDEDVLFYNRLNLEGGKDGWFMRMVDSVVQNEDNVYILIEQVDIMYIGVDDAQVEEFYLQSLFYH